MIEFTFQEIPEIALYSGTRDWLTTVLLSEGKRLGDISYIFCDDAYLLNININFLSHDFYTDVITFDYVRGSIVSGDIFISLPRVQDNAQSLDITFPNELYRVMVHGLLHLCGYKDKTEKEQLIMRSKEDFYLDRLSEKK